MTTPVSVRLDETIKERITALAGQRQRSAHWLMREAIEQYVDREEKRQAFLQAGREAWEHYQATGQHVTGEEADAWLAQLEAGNNVNPPECHG
ncbi:MAG: ribbon-helix-helix protein, CopG family [Betaproteobacteria bacterium]|nr:MAG: ribbon-helix-helix protein, CopG family [Betaproteobacteria bacterium]